MIVSLSSNAARLRAAFNESNMARNMILQDPSDKCDF